MKAIDLSNSVSFPLLFFVFFKRASEVFLGTKGITKAADSDCQSVSGAAKDKIGGSVTITELIITVVTSLKKNTTK